MGARKLYEYDGKTLTLPEWSKETGVSAATLRRRLRAGWTLERTLTEPARKSPVEPGQLYGELKVLWEDYGKAAPGKARYFRCRCSCGTLVSVRCNDLRSGNSTNCGCVRKEKARAQLTTHGLRDHYLYDRWNQMRQRCNNPNNRSYHRYGGRGIKYDPAWDSFIRFLQDVGEPPDPSWTLERIDNDGDYTKENVRWVPRQVQMNNTSKNTHLTLDGVKLTIAEWSRELGINYQTIINRLQSGWSVDRALTTATATAQTITIDGREQTIRQWAEEKGIDEAALRWRLNNGWDVLRALTQPVRHKKKGPSPLNGAEPGPP